MTDMNDVGDESDFRAEADRFVAEGGLGRSGPLKRLFDYMADRAVAGRSITEVDIAIDVFGKTGADPGDASVRVYIHRLRKKLDEFYHRSEETGAKRLIVPRGEYRLALADRERLEPETLRRSGRQNVLVAGVAVALALIVGLAVGAFLWPSREAGDPLAEVAKVPMWAALAEDPRPILVVVGDYYILGDAEDGEVVRMVREFGVNSAVDLERFLFENPDKVGEYVDMNLSYVPTGAAQGLNEVLPLARMLADGRQVRTITSSELTPEMLRANHIIYVGFLSGLRSLENTVFSRSRFGVGGSYDEILDYETREVYVSQAGLPAEDSVHKDYGYISSFEGPNRARIVVLGGTRDVGVMHAAEAATDPQAMRDLAQSVDGSASLEGLYEVEALGRTNLMGFLVLSTPRPDQDVPTGLP
jgi:hypothetical protein